MINLELDVDDLFINNHTMKTADFFSNAVLSITKVINHFNCFEKAFEGLTADELIKIEENTLYNEDVFKPIVNKADSIFYKYKHKFSLNIFLTDHIVHPFTSILKDYCSMTYCKIFLTRNGMLRAVRFVAEIKSFNHKSFGVTYNDLFEIDSISRMYLVKKCYNQIKAQVKSYCDNESDEKYFIDLFLKDAETKLVDYLPEYSIPSAYNFHSDEFYIRLKVAEMMLL
jgi:hypothetical protein